jgi:hypothetical protein
LAPKNLGVARAMTMSVKVKRNELNQHDDARGLEFARGFTELDSNHLSASFGRDGK